jgi:hypothetical protein
VVRQKGGLAAGQKTTRRLAGLSRMMAALVIRRGDRAAVRTVSQGASLNLQGFWLTPGRAPIGSGLGFRVLALASISLAPRCNNCCDALGRRLRKIQCLQLSVCWCPDPLNYPHVIAVTKCASQALTQLRNRATPTSVFINAPRVPVRCGLLFGLPTRRLRDRGTGRAFHRCGGAAIRSSTVSSKLSVHGRL